MKKKALKGFQIIISFPLIILGMAYYDSSNLLIWKILSGLLIIISGSFFLEPLFSMFVKGKTDEVKDK